MLLSRLIFRKKKNFEKVKRRCSDFDRLSVPLKKKVTWGEHNLENLRLMKLK